jgi:hypothetical protein
LTLYRRHNPSCSKASDRYWKRCTCPMWVEGVVEGGEYLRKSLKTKSWERAQILSKALEESPEKSPETKAGPVTIEHAVTEYLADGKARELAEATVYKLDITFRKQFLTWCKAEGYKLLRELDLAAMRTASNEKHQQHQAYHLVLHAAMHGHTQRRCERELVEGLPDFHSCPSIFRPLRPVIKCAAHRQPMIRPFRGFLQ